MFRTSLRRCGALLSLPLLALAALPAQAQTPSALQDRAHGESALQVQIFLLRHAEAGSGSADPALTEEGRQRAEAIAEQLADVPFEAIYTTDYRRTRETAAPLAEVIGLEPRFYDPRDLRGFAATLAESGGPVLVVGHSNTTPALVALLGGAPGAPIAHDDHDRLYWLDGNRTRRLTAGGIAPLLLGPCEAAGLPAGARCGTYSVPEGGSPQRDIPLRVALLPGGETAAASPMLAVLPGGPGLGGSHVAAGVRQMLGPLTQGRDVLLVDQRGTGGSNPLVCEQGASLGEALLALGRTDVESLAACKEALETRADLTRYTTPLAADDLDRIRQALGEPVLDLFGMSYGSRLALEAMRMHPDGVGVAILRAAAPPAMKLPLFTPRDAQASLDRLIAACAKQAACARAYPDLAGDVGRVLSRLAEGPVTVSVTDPRDGQVEEVAFTHEAFTTSLFFLLYVPELYVHLPRLVHTAAEGDFAPLVGITGPMVASTLGQIAEGLRLSVLCAEDISRIDPASVEEATRGTFFGTMPVRSDMQACEIWPVAQVEPGFFEPVRADTETLIISGGFDPVAGPDWGEAVAEALPNARHIVVPAASHYPPVPRCAAGLARTLLETRTLPEGSDPCADEPAAATIVVPQARAEEARQ
ncbi:alpha/beta fold hydrolase [Parvularcula oceani]|uniref:alpha/beta fold hydrolase n=1 Tax=Parvularcula oceani TaxID=1247963 RepID=UPI00068EDD3E|nr:alpha/beta fold hydrolase [Parvularcula oceani]